jgi:hypothetical protein
VHENAYEYIQINKLIHYKVSYWLSLSVMTETKSYDTKTFNKCATAAQKNVSDLRRFVSRDRIEFFSSVTRDINAIAFNSSGVSLVHFLSSKYSHLPGKVENTKIKS